MKGEILCKPGFSFPSLLVWYKLLLDGGVKVIATYALMIANKHETHLALLSPDITFNMVAVMVVLILLKFSCAWCFFYLVWMVAGRREGGNQSSEVSYVLLNVVKFERLKV